MTDYLSCELKYNEDKSKAWNGQPHSIKKLEKKFKHLTKRKSCMKTPGTPGIKSLKPENDEECLSDELQTEYRSGTGMLLYLVKHSRPDISNAVRELTKCMDKACMRSYKEMERVIRFVLSTKKFGLKVEPHMNKEVKEWDLMVFTDSDWGGDKETRISVTGFIIFLMGVPIHWGSKGQRSVAISSSEAEFYALSEAAK